jgi:alkanesulfonate monooxygenase SsuD/methylene tetrahydromethanopterin reductase-like flavin-dependent oxidoreductase (luciferase family)
MPANVEEERVLEFGIQFFPAVGPAEKSARDYWRDALDLVGLCDTLGYTSVRTVEHYFRSYGGYSPNPLTFLAAAAGRTSRARLITGAVLPIFNHPLKIAAEIGLVDAISNGRLEAGFARAFLPHEFARFGVSVDQSRARFDEGLEQVRRLLEEEDVTCEGQFHSFRRVTSLPRPTQRPRPPFWIAAVTTPESFANAGKLGHSVMCVPFVGGKMRELLQVYRDAWRAAGHPGAGRVMMSFHMYCAPTFDEARAIARDSLNRYLKSFVAAASDWVEGVNSKDYPNYDKMIESLSKETFESQVEKGLAWIGPPDQIVRNIEAFSDAVGGFDIASLQVNFGTIPYADASRSMALFAEQVMPRFVRHRQDSGYALSSS